MQKLGISKKRRGFFKLTRQHKRFSNFFVFSKLDEYETERIKEWKVSMEEKNRDRSELFTQKLENFLVEEIISGPQKLYWKLAEKNYHLLYCVCFDLCDQLRLKKKILNSRHYLFYKKKRKLSHFYLWAPLLFRIRATIVLFYQIFLVFHNFIILKYIFIPAYYYYAYGNLLPAFFNFMGDFIVRVLIFMKVCNSSQIQLFLLKIAIPLTLIKNAVLTILVGSLIAHFLSLDKRFKSA